MTPPNRLRRARFEMGLTINEVAAATAVSRATIMRLEAGSTPTARVAKALADFYGLDVADMLTPDPQSRAVA